MKKDLKMKEIKYEKILTLKKTIYQKMNQLKK